MILRDYQDEAVERVFDYFNHNTGNPVVAMPTGVGKSLVIGGFAKRAMQTYAGTRIMVATHVKELVEQNAAKLQAHWPQAPIGIYSAGLGQRDTQMPIIFGGCASIVNCVKDFGRRDLLIIDEAHLLSPKNDTTYQSIILELKESNPKLKTIGLTATPFRLGQGMITDGGIFTDIACNMTGVDAFNRFIAEGYLAPLVPKRTKTELDVSNVGMNANGDFSTNGLEDELREDVIYPACIEMCELGYNRNSWIVFTAGVKSAETAARILTSFGIRAEAMHSKLPKKLRDQRLKEFKLGIIRCLCTNNMLTTGFDHPPLDMIAMLRATMSPGLWVQMLGRGTRPSPETQKSDCLVLDFAGNTRRLGPINDPVIPRKKGGGGGDAPVRLCDECGTYNHASARFCSFCGEAFTFQPKIIQSASTEELIRSDLPIVEYFNVTQAMYYLYEKPGSPPMIKVEYSCEGGLHRFTEYVGIQHPGFPGKKARDWWRQRFPGDYVPETTSEALREISRLRCPARLKVWVNKKYPEILNYEY